MRSSPNHSLPPIHPLPPVSSFNNEAGFKIIIILPHRGSDLPLCHPSQVSIAHLPTPLGFRLPTRPSLPGPDHPPPVHPSYVPITHLATPPSFLSPTQQPSFKGLDHPLVHQLSRSPREQTSRESGLIIIYY